MKSLSVLHESDHFLSIDKPSGLLSIPDRYDDSLPSAYTILKRRYKSIFPVHRLDRLTSGVLLFAKDEETHKYLSGLFEHRMIQKEYTAIVQGVMESEEGKIAASIAQDPFRKGVMKIDKRGKESTTLYKVIQTFDTGYSLVNFCPLMGRTHQIRVHAQCINHPIACDPVYGDGRPVFLSSFKRKFHLSKRADPELPLLKRLALHASSVQFQLPNGEDCHITSPLPKDMKALLYQLQKLD